MKITVSLYLLAIFFTANAEIVTQYVCEGSTLKINCGNEKINVISAAYGRSVSYSERCYASISKPPSISCLASSSVLKVTQFCQSQSSCNVHASNSVFGDPCVSTYKYLQVTYECIGENGFGVEEGEISFVHGPATESVLVPVTRIIEAKQSSTRDAGGAASRAIDGNTNGIFNKHSCTHTACGDEKNPWWYAQLDSSKPISKVVIYNREDCCGERLIGAEIRVGDDNKSPFNENAQCGATLTSAMIGSNPIEVICNKPIKGKYISVRLPGKKCLTLCEVEIYESVLVTHFVGAKQSSTRGAGGDANRAIDGNTNSIFNQNSCSHTAGESDKNPWWYADLGTPKPISKIVLYNRQDCCADRLIDAQIRVGNTSKSPFTDNVPCGSTVTSTMIESNPIEIVCNKPITGQYITVYLPGTKILTICEVEVYAGIW